MFIFRLVDQIANIGSLDQYLSILKAEKRHFDGEKLIFLLVNICWFVADCKGNLVRLAAQFWRRGEFFVR